MDPNQMPAAPPPPGSMSDFNSADNYKHRNIVLHTVVLAITTVAVVIRVYTRAAIKRNFGVDDCEFCILALRRFVLMLEQGWRCYHGYVLETLSVRTRG
jgi:hypothetical protein